MSFTSKRIIRAKTLGDRLVEAREDKGVSLGQAAKDSGVAFKYLEALEQNRPEGLPGLSYAKNFLQIYCRYLQIDFNACWAEARQFSWEKSRPHAVNQKYLWSWPRLLRRGLLAIGILAIVVFLSFKIMAIFAPPRLVISSPVEGLVTTGRQVTVAGRSEPEVELSINNRLIFVDKAGQFSTLVDLQKGLNSIKITAKKKYSRMSEAEIRVLLKD